MSDLVKLQHQSAVEIQAELTESQQATRRAEAALALKEQELQALHALYAASIAV